MNNIDFADAVMYYNIYQNNPERMLLLFMGKFNMTNEQAITAIEEVKVAIEENEPRRKFVISFMHYTGENYHKLTDEQQWHVYCNADGFGRRTSSQLRRLNGGWDWSHVRDSTINGWKNMEIVLGHYGFKK